MPRGVCTTSGWNCTAYMPRPGCSMAATGAPSLVARREKPAGAAVMQSRWLIQHCSSAARPSRRVPLASIRSRVLPNSLVPVRVTVPPSSSAMSWAP